MQKTDCTDRLLASLERCARSGDYLETFYGLLFAKSPSFRARFEHVDMEEQKRKLADSLPQLIRLPLLDPDSAQVQAARRAHQARHHGGWSPKYVLWLETVCETVRRHDPECDSELEYALKERLTQAVRLLHPDIETPQDVDLLVRRFYTRVYQDEVLRPMFAEVAGVDLEEHLPRMNRFWNTVLFGERSYRGNPMQVHCELDSKKPLNECHFLRWLSLFRLTVDELFHGPNAARAKAAAERINLNIETQLGRLRRRQQEGASL